MIERMTAPEFYATWTPTAAIAAATDPVGIAVSTVWLVDGVEVPLVTCALGALGILSARPLARNREAKLPLWQFLLVSAIMLILVELWIIQSQPGWLFAFVVAIGLGFSGYSLIELLGEEIRGLVTSAFALARERIAGWIGSSKGDKK